MHRVLTQVLQAYLLFNYYYRHCSYSWIFINPETERVLNSLQWKDVKMHHTLLCIFLDSCQVGAGQLERLHLQKGLNLFKRIEGCGICDQKQTLGGEVALNWGCSGNQITLGHHSNLHQQKMTDPSSPIPNSPRGLASSAGEAEARWINETPNHTSRQLQAFMSINFA